MNTTTKEKTKELLKKSVGVALQNTDKKPKKNLNMKIKIGIDPGVATGLAVSKNGSLTEIACMTILEAIDRCKTLFYDYLNSDIDVYVEDACKRSGSKEMAFGAGHVVRDCKIWKEFSRDYNAEYWGNINFHFVKPDPSLTKFNDEKFKQYTNWQPRTNSHSRDAAMLIYGL